MNILYLMVPMSVALGALFLFGFWKSVDSGQFDDLDRAASEFRFDEEENINKKESRHE